MNTTTTDAELVTSFLSGDRGALAGIYDRYAAGLYDTAAAMLSDRHDAADMVQDVFCIAAERLGQLREPDRLKPWLYAVLRNEVYRRTKKRRRALPTDFTAEGVPDVVAPRDPAAEGESLAYDELASLVRSAAAGLDERDQLVLELSVRQGLTGADLADALGVTPEQSYSMVHRMRERVDKSIGAFVVARTGRKDCATLAEILRGWDGEFNVLVRKRVARHVESCSVCERKRTAVAPLALFAAAPVFVLPLGLRDRVLAAATPATSSGPARTPHSSRRLRFDRHDGFPRAARFGRHAIAWTAGATAAVVIGAGLVVATVDRDGSSTPRDPVVTATTDTTVPATTIPVTAIPETTIPVTMDPATTAPNTTIAGSPKPSTTVASNTPSTLPTATVVAPAGTPTTATPNPTTVAPTTTQSPVRTTVAPAYTGPFLALNSSSVAFGPTATTASIVVSNPSPRTVSWTASVPATVSAFFVASPSSGSLRSGASATVTFTFNRVAAGDYANTALFPEKSGFSLPATFAAGTAPLTTTLTAKVSGRVTRAPLVRSTSVTFSGSTLTQTCMNTSIVVNAVDESGVKSVTGTATLVNNDGTTSTRSLVFTNQGDKIGWVATVNDLLAKTAAVNVSATATDNLGLTTTVNAAQKRPTTC